MAQVSVTQFYNTRKHQRNLGKDNDFHKSLNDATKLEEVPCRRKIDNAVKDKILKEKDILSEKSSDSKEEILVGSKPVSKSKAAAKKASTRSKVSKPSKRVTVKKDNSQKTITSFYSNTDLSECKKTDESSLEQLSLPTGQKESDDVPNCSTLSEVSKNNSTFNVVDSKIDFKDHVKEIKAKDTCIVQSPKRKVPIPVELTPSKKRQHVDTGNSGSPIVKSSTACRKLEMGLPSSPCKMTSPFHSPVKCLAPSPRKLTSPFHTPVKSQAPSPRKLMMSPKETVNAVIDQSRAKLMLSPKLGELRKSLEIFSRKTSIIKTSMIQSNPYKITSVVSPTKTKCNMPVLPKTPACERFSHLVGPDTTLNLPKKYKLLWEIFRSTDTVVSMLHNRKELVTFEKVQDGVQKMMKRKFFKSHLGQIVTVLPSAYKVTLEKCSAMSKKIEKKDYQVVITPMLSSNEKAKKSNTVVFEPMTPACMAARVNEFNEALLKITLKHHAVFLERSKLPCVPDKDLKYWNLKFPLDLVPDIEPATLPEPPENKVWTAKDVLSKVRGAALNSRVVKALQSVADESEKNITLELKDASNSKPDSNKALKGVCADLLAKVRAREAAKHIELMTRTPEETKKQAMLQRLPKIVNILWHYFIAERKVAVPVDVVIEKVIHSFNSLTTPDDVKDHLKLIKETFPGWLTFIEIRKGVFIQIDRNKNIKEMLDKFQF